MTVCPYEQIIAGFHHFCPSLPKVQKVTADRKKAMQARWKEHKQDSDTQTYEMIAKVFRHMEASDFHSGRSGEWDGGNFDWLMKPKNFQKMLEKEPRQTQAQNYDATHANKWQEGKW